MPNTRFPLGWECSGATMRARTPQPSRCRNRTNNPIPETAAHSPRESFVRNWRSRAPRTVGGAVVDIDSPAGLAWAGGSPRDAKSITSLLQPSRNKLLPHLCNNGLFGAGRGADASLGDREQAV